MDRTSSTRASPSLAVSDHDHDGIDSSIEMSNRDFPGARSVSSLPPADRGREAWLFLTGCFFIETLLWGFPLSYGVLRNYYVAHAPFDKDGAGASAVGTTCSGILYLCAPILYILLQTYPAIRRRACVFGVITLSLSIILSSFCRSISTIIITQGVMYSVGGSFLYRPIYFFIDEWFVARKGFAYGIMWAGSGLGGFSGPLIMNQLLEKFGFEVAMRAWGVAILVISGPLMWFIKPRLPASSAARGGRARRVKWQHGWQFLTTRMFWILQIANIFQGLGYFMPSLYLPQYVSSLNYSPFISSVVVCALNAASMPGVIVLSTLCDKTHVTNILLVSTLGSAIAVLILWGLSASLSVTVVFAVIYGFFAGGFTSTYAGIVKSLREVAPESEMGNVFGLLSLGRGIGNVISGPLSAVLLNQAKIATESSHISGYQSGYSVLIIFTGLTASLAMCGWAGRVLRMY